MKTDFLPKSVLKISALTLAVSAAMLGSVSASADGTADCNAGDQITALE